VVCRTIDVAAAERMQTPPVIGQRSIRVDVPISCATHAHPTHFIMTVRPTTQILRSHMPEGNFGWNQLLDGSISFSPLYPCMTNDLHVSIATSLRQRAARPHMKFTV